MRIAMIGPFGLHPNKTMESRALSLARALVGQGHEVAIFMPPWQTPDEADKTWQVDGVTLRYVPLRGGTLGITRTLLRETLAWQPDVVHCFKPKAYSGLVAWWLWQFHRRNLPLVMDSDDWEGWGGWNDRADYSPLQKRFFAWQEQWGMRHAHALTVASRALETIALSMGIQKEHLLYLPNGSGLPSGEDATSQPHNPATSQPTLLLYSRLFEFDTARLVAILAGVKTAVPTLKILAIGTGLFADEAAQFRQQAQAAGVWEAIEDVGWVALEKLAGLLKTAVVGLYLMDDTLLNRTKCPVKLADMIRVGLPVVGEAVGQVPEYIVHGQTGFVRESGDVAGITADLVQLLQTPSLRHQLGTAASTHYQANFSWQQQAAKLENMYLSLVEKVK